MRIRLFDGDREALRHLFREADDSDAAIDGCNKGGKYKMKERKDKGEIE